MNVGRPSLRPAQLIADHWRLLVKGAPKGPILDLACGEGNNGIFLASKGLSVILCDNSGEALSRAKALATKNQVKVQYWQVDLETEGVNPLPEDTFAGILVFRYLHRPLIPCIKKAVKRGGTLIYETFTVEQPRFGRPHNPNFLLKRGELQGWFKDWEVIHCFEGIREEPKRAVAELVCQRPSHQ